MMARTSILSSKHGPAPARPKPEPEPFGLHGSTGFSGIQLFRKSSCTCGGGCPTCQGKSGDLKISHPSDPAEIEADRMAERVMRMPLDKASSTSMAGPQNVAASGTIHRKCDSCHEEEEQNTVHRKPLHVSNGGPSAAPQTVREAVSSGGRPLDHGTRSFFEPRFGYDLSSVQIHTGPSADQSARTADARAYTLGHDIVFAEGEFHPESETGRHLLAHELAHVVQGGADPNKLSRTPANKVSCANHTPLVIPGSGLSIADPVGVITAAEDRANEMFDAVIGELDFTLGRIRGGAPIGWPTIADPIAEGLRLMGLDPDDPAIWNAPDGTGLRSVPLLLRRLRLIRRTIGAGSFLFFCLGNGMTRIGGCSVTSGDICTGAVLTTCAGEFLTAMCPGFWAASAENQAARIVHESAHNFATFIGHSGRFHNAECFARLVQVYAGVDVAEQRVDLCPDP
jgi:hypothetical protein